MCVFQSLLKNIDEPTPGTLRFGKVGRPTLDAEASRRRLFVRENIPADLKISETSVP
jgi:hypothetical protein